MNFTEYQSLARRTSNQEDYPDDLLNAALGITGEAGEIADCIKKVVYHTHKLDKTVIAAELGDLMWYLAKACDAIGWDMEDVAEANIEKLRKRYPNGFEVERSVNREG